jgi:hypothetical protein
VQIAVELFLVDGSIDGEEIDYALAGTYDKIEEWDQLVRTITDAKQLRYSHGISIFDDKPVWGLLPRLSMKT